MRRFVVGVGVWSLLGGVAYAADGPPEVPRSPEVGTPASPAPERKVVRWDPFDRDDAPEPLDAAAVMTALREVDEEKLRRLYEEGAKKQEPPLPPTGPLSAEDFEKTLAMAKSTDPAQRALGRDDLMAILDSLGMLPKVQVKPRSFFDVLGEKGFSLRRASEGPDKADGALLSYEHDEEDGSDVFRVQAFLKYVRKPVADAASMRRFAASLELNLSSDPDEQNENGAGAFRVRAGAEGFRMLASSPPRNPPCSSMCLRGFEWGARAKFDSSQDSTVQKLSAEAFLSPVDSRLGWGMVVPPGPAPRITFFWQPTFLAEGGTTLKEGESWERGSEFFRLGVSVRASLHFDALMRKMRLNAPGADFGDGEVPAFLPYLFAEYVSRWSFADEDTVFEYFTGGVHFPLMRNVGLEASYEQGELAPKFERVERVTVGLGVRF